MTDKLSTSSEQNDYRLKAGNNGLIQLATGIVGLLENNTLNWPFTSHQE
ncbi:hypothetical protein H4J38_12885 [Colwellia sp. BRX10-3]|nr:hypothetical protein [Colwellia sp. BRX10-3]MBA6391664.1 hypothetical protein [Colwellia sp. BRX10-3]